MSELNTSTKNWKSKKKAHQTDDGLSKNNSKSVRFRIRVQQEEEAEKEIKEYRDLDDEDNR